MSLEDVNGIQKKIYDFIVEYIRDNGIPPTNREIGSAVNIASIGHVDYHLAILEKKGYITRESKKARGIKLLRSPIGIPVAGQIAEGEPLDLDPYPSELLDAGREIEQEGLFALKVKGQAMIEDNIIDKDYVIIKPQDTCERGDIIVAVNLQSGRATLRRFFQEIEQDRVRLQPANSEMDPIYVPKMEWNYEWQVQGKVVAIFRKPDFKKDTIFRIHGEDQPNTKISSTLDQMVQEKQEVITLRRLRVFLCHSSGDKLSVRQLYQRLKACNVDPWLDEEDLLAGQEWEHEIRKTVRATDIVIVCLSHASISKTGFVQKEIKFALDVAEEKPIDNIFLVPLMLEECDIPEQLRRWQAVKFYEANGFDKLIKSLKFKSESISDEFEPVNLPKELS